jgi:hypothetical protein
MVTAMEPEMTRGEVDDRDPAAGFHAPHDVAREGGAVAHVMKHRPHVDRAAAVVGEVRGVVPSLDDPDIRGVRARGGVGDRAATVGIELRGEHFPTLSKKLRDGHGVRSVAGADISDAIAR